MQGDGKERRECRTGIGPLGDPYEHHPMPSFRNKELNGRIFAVQGVHLNRRSQPRG